MDASSAALRCQASVAHTGDQLLLHSPSHSLCRPGTGVAAIGIGTHIAAGCRLARIVPQHHGQLLSGKDLFHIAAVGDTLLHSPLLSGLIPTARRNRDIRAIVGGQHSDEHSPGHGLLRGKSSLAGTGEDLPARSKVNVRTAPIAVLYILKTLAVIHDFYGLPIFQSDGHTGLGGDGVLHNLLGPIFLDDDGHCSGGHVGDGDLHLSRGAGWQNHGYRGGILTVVGGGYAGHGKRNGFPHLGGILHHGRGQGHLGIHLAGFIGGDHRGSTVLIGYRCLAGPVRLGDGLSLVALGIGRGLGDGTVGLGHDRGDGAIGMDRGFCLMVRAGSPAAGAPAGPSRGGLFPLGSERHTLGEGAGDAPQESGLSLTPTGKSVARFLQSGEDHRDRLDFCGEDDLLAEVIVPEVPVLVVVLDKLQIAAGQDMVSGKNRAVLIEGNAAAVAEGVAGDGLVIACDTQLGPVQGVASELALGSAEDQAGTALQRGVGDDEGLQFSLFIIINGMGHAVKGTVVHCDGLMVVVGTTDKNAIREIFAAQKGHVLEDVAGSCADAVPVCTAGKVQCKIAEGVAAIGLECLGVEGQYMAIALQRDAGEIADGTPSTGSDVPQQRNGIAGLGSLGGSAQIRVGLTVDLGHSRHMDGAARNIYRGRGVGAIPQAADIALCLQNILPVRATVNFAGEFAVLQGGRSFAAVV